MKLTKSKKAVQFIDEFGNVFQTSVVVLKNLLAGGTRGNIVLLNRLPFKVSVDRFATSEVWNPNDLPIPSLLPDGQELADDALSRKTRDKKRKKKVYVDKEV